MGPICRESEDWQCKVFLIIVGIMAVIGIFLAVGIAVSETVNGCYAYAKVELFKDNAFNYQQFTDGLGKNNYDVINVDKQDSTGYLFNLKFNEAQKSKKDCPSSNAGLKEIKFDNTFILYCQELSACR